MCDDDNLASENFISNGSSVTKQVGVDSWDIFKNGLSIIGFIKFWPHDSAKLFVLTENLNKKKKSKF